MATVINNPERERVVEVDRTDSSGWAVAVIVLIVAVVVGVWAYARYYPSAPAAPAGTSNGGANINVTLPAGDGSGSDLPDSGAAY